jgi:pilus assembly protein Flp/PilA
MRALLHFLSDESATTSIEYGVIVGLIGVGLISVINTLGSQLAVVFDGLMSALDGVPPPGNSGNGA